MQLSFHKFKCLSVVELWLQLCYKEYYLICTLIWLQIIPIPCIRSSKLFALSQRLYVWCFSIPPPPLRAPKKKGACI